MTAGLVRCSVDEEAARRRAQAGVTLSYPRIRATPPDRCYPDQRERWENKTFQQKHGEHVVLGESSEFRRLRHAVEKAAGDRERAIRNVCRLYGVKTLDGLPVAIRAATLVLLGPHV
jgi:hypothetical protein